MAPAAVRNCHQEAAYARSEAFSGRVGQGFEEHTRGSGRGMSVTLTVIEGISSVSVTPVTVVGEKATFVFSWSDEGVLEEMKERARRLGGDVLVDLRHVAVSEHESEAELTATVGRFTRVDCRA